jgi:hypothetical protein
VGPRAGLDGCGKVRPHRDSIPGPSSPYRVAIPTELSRSTVFDMKSAIDSVFSEPLNGGSPQGHINCKSFKSTLLPELLGLPEDKDNTIP